MSRRRVFVSAAGRADITPNQTKRLLLPQDRNGAGTSDHMLENDGDSGRQEDDRAIPSFNPDLIVMSFIIRLFE